MDQKVKVWKKSYPIKSTWIFLNSVPFNCFVCVSPLNFTPILLCFALPARYQDDLISAQAGSPCDTCLAKRHHRQRSCYYCTGWWLGVESHGHPCQLCESGPYHDLQLRELSTQTHRAFLSSSMMLPPGMTSQLFATSLTSLPAHINFFGLVVIERI